mmetsp:Transcript_30880/g.65084  ORF Transcript_30880/g.65084 Transcript_30880/m.65084 type:complete len:212 (+) Transcript_30880:2588-3223(+)
MLLSKFLDLAINGMIPYTNTAESSSLGIFSIRELTITMVLVCPYRAKIRLTATTSTMSYGDRSMMASSGSVDCPSATRRACLSAAAMTCSNMSGPDENSSSATILQRRCDLKLIFFTENNVPPDTSILTSSPVDLSPYSSDIESHDDISFLRKSLTSVPSDAPIEFSSLASDCIFSPFALIARPISALSFSLRANTRLFRIKWRSISLSDR